MGGFAQLAGVGVETHVGADAYKAADRLDGEHQRTIGEPDAADVFREQAEQFVLFGGDPAAITRTVTVRDLQTRPVHIVAQFLLYDIDGCFYHYAT